MGVGTVYEHSGFFFLLLFFFLLFGFQMNGNVCMPALHIVPSHASIKPVDEQRSRVVKNCNLQPPPHQPPLLHHVVQVYTSRASAIKQWDKYVAPDEQRAQRITDDGGPTAPVEAQGRGQGEPDPAG